MNFMKIMNLKIGHLLISKALVYWYDKNIRFVRSIVQTLIWNEYSYDLASEERIEREEGERGGRESQRRRN